MTYSLFHELPALLASKLITKRPHPYLPLDIYNYSAAAQHKPIAEWSQALKDCRGLILDRNGVVVGRPFSKFWNYEQVLTDIPNEPFTVWEKMDGSLGIVCSYAGERVVATRGSFESDQAKWFSRWLQRYHKEFLPSDLTYLFEIVYPENRIVVDYGKTEGAFLLAVKATDGLDVGYAFNHCTIFDKARRYDGLSDFFEINANPAFEGQEGFVVQWVFGFRAKVKLEEYKRLHRIIYNTSTRSIWDTLRKGGNTAELLERVPDDFKVWAQDTINTLWKNFTYLTDWAATTFEDRPIASRCWSKLLPEERREFAQWAKLCSHPNLLFSLLDGKDITDAVWKMIEPRWATPFKGETD